MYRRPFLVLPGGDCIPLEGDWRLEPLRGEWYVLGHHTALRFETESEAQARLDSLRGIGGPDALAEMALELAGGESGEAAFAPDWLRSPPPAPRSTPLSTTGSMPLSAPRPAESLFGESDLG